MKYKLLAAHFSEEDKYLEEGTEVGDGTRHRWTRPPTTQMEGLDEESQEEIDRLKLRVGEGDPLNELPMTVGPDFDLSMLGAADKQRLLALLTNSSANEVGSDVGLRQQQKPAASSTPEHRPTRESSGARPAMAVRA
jgi:hypothetical protein